MLGDSIKIYRWDNTHSFITGQLECVIFYDKIYPIQLIIGGRSLTAAKSTIMKMQLENCTSSYATASLSAQRSGMQSFSNSSYIWSLGGYSSISTPTVLFSIEKLSSSTITNSSTSSSLSTRCKYYASHCNTGIYGYVFGGSLNASPTTNKVSDTYETFEFSTETHAEQSSLLSGKCATGSATYDNNGNIFIGYGRNASYSSTNTIQKFIEASRTIVSSPTYALNINLGNHSVSKNNYSAYYFGGNTTSSVNTIRNFSFVTLLPSTLSAALVTEMQDMSIVSDNSMTTAYICGGFRYQSVSTAYSTVQSFKFSNHTVNTIQRTSLPEAAYESGTALT